MRRFPDLTGRIELILRPTPLHRLHRLSEELQVDLWIKRDDLTGFAMGGNKGRKLEYLAGEIAASGADVVVAQGASQSNFIRQLAAACALIGVKCAAATMRLPYFEAAGKPTQEGLEDHGGNVLLDQLFEVDLRQFPDDDWEVLAEHTERLAQEYESKGLKVHRLQLGGSGVRSAYAFCQAAEEAELQAGTFDTLVTPSSSGSTHAGLAYAHFQRGTRVIGISADPDPEGELLSDIARLCRELDTLTGIDQQMDPADLDLRMDYHGGAYSVPSEAGMQAIRRLAHTEGILLDPVYSGKAFAGLLDLVERGELGGRVLFWHTGGLPTLFAMPGTS